ncbi:MAG TPA: hypothetical protein VEA58_11525 [Anaerovoracaceae bacterium]|nr:hypothetical protein [Anaerovoracaceae bacterium]
MAPQNKKILIVVGIAALLAIGYFYCMKEQEKETNEAVLSPENAADVIDIVAAQQTA